MGEQLTMNLRTNRRRTFIDMDGTIADFYGAALPFHGCPDLYNMKVNQGIYRAQDILKLNNTEFWGPIDKVSDFWVEMPQTLQAAEIVSIAVGLFGIENCAILTAPSLNPNCVPGKRNWIKKNFPELADRIIFTHAKEFLAGNGNVLFDDSDEMINNFREAGGIGVLIPRAWNSLHKYSAPMSVMAAIREQLKMEGI